MDRSLKKGTMPNIIFNNKNNARKYNTPRHTLRPAGDPAQLTSPTEPHMELKVGVLKMFLCMVFSTCTVLVITATGKALPNRWHAK